MYDSNNYGQFKILGKTGELYRTEAIVEIEFVLTGYRTTLPMSKALAGIVKDPYYPIIDGVGYFGEGSKVTDNKRIYNIWGKMISRCYNESDPSYCFYGAIGVTVDPRWFNYSVFAEDIKQVDGYQLMINNPYDYSMDKDLKQLQLSKDQRVYSKNTCTFITKSDNSKIRCYESNYTPYETLSMPDLTISNSLKTMVVIVNKNA